MKTYNAHDTILLRSLILMIVLYGAISLLLAVLGMFYATYVWPTWGLLVILLYLKKIISFPRPSRECIFYALVALSFIFLISLFTVPTIFTGRDQGTISTAAIQLAQSHSLITHTPESTTFFEIYGTGKALNFPGFFYTPDGGLLTQFPLPYITFLAGFFVVFGINGLIIANCVLLFSATLCITWIARSIVSATYTIIFLVLFLSSFAIGWFAKFTLSENLAIFLVWSATFLYILLKQSPTKASYFTFFITLGLLLFSRLEGIWFFFIFMLLLARSKAITTFLKKDLWWHVVFPLTTLFTISCVVAIMNMPFIYTMLRVFVKTTQSDAGTQTVLENITYHFSLYTIYGLIGPLILTAIACVIAIKYKRYRAILLPVAITLPIFSYYLFPHISDDHPWMLRRFVFAVLPATLLVSTFFLHKIAQKGIRYKYAAYILFAILLLGNLPATWTYITYAENPTLLRQTRDFSEKFSGNDLLLIDKNATGKGWSMIPGPLRSLEGLHAVYFFNPEDYHKIDTSQFENVYLIAPNDHKEMYMDSLNDNMHYWGKYVFIVDELQTDEKKSFPESFPQKERSIIRNTIYELKK